MSVYKRGETYWVQFTDSNGNRVQKSAFTKDKKEAEEVEVKLKHDAWKAKQLGVKPKKPWQEAVVRWLNEHEHKRSLETDKSHLRWLDQHLGKKNLQDINKNTIDYIKQAKKAEGASNSTVNRVLSLLRAILNKAQHEWEWIDFAPSIKLLVEPAGRVRWLTYEEADRLANELPEHLRLMFRFTLATGLRESNVTHLEWSKIDMVRKCAWVNAENSKSGRAIPIPLNADAMAIIRSQIGKHQTRVFTYKGNPVNDANGKAWRKALVRAGIDNFRWHDVRHTWASWHVQNGTRLEVLKELGGWSDLSMVLRYAHLSADHLAEHAGNVSQVKNNVTELRIIK